MKKKTKDFLLFLALSYIIAFLFESLAFLTGDGGLYRSLSGLVFFFVWYGILYSLTLLFFKKRPLWTVALAWFVIGPVLEILVFKRIHWIDSVIYAIMFLIPLWVYKKKA